MNDKIFLGAPDNGNILFTLNQTFAAQACSLASQAFQLKLVCAAGLDALAMCYCVILQLDHYLGEPPTVLHFIQSAIRFWPLPATPILFLALGVSS